jgi:hypothetical protein
VGSGVVGLGPQVIGTQVAELLIEGDSLGPVLAGLVGVADKVHIIAKSVESFCGVIGVPVLASAP